VLKGDLGDVESIHDATGDVDAYLLTVGLGNADVAGEAADTTQSKFLV
jgi:hypothetical protein